MNYDYMILQNHTIPVNENDGLPLSKCYWAILATALGVGISVIDVTIANVALPTIACDLGTSPSATIWIVNAYQIAITISLLSFSSLGDIYGYRRIYLSGVLLFSITLSKKGMALYSFCKRLSFPDALLSVPACVMVKT